MGKIIEPTKTSTGHSHIGDVLDEISLSPKPARIAHSAGMSKPRVLILTGLGINSHAELGWCFNRAGADVDYMHVNDLIKKPELLDKYQGLGLAGGFAMGDQLGAGQSLASRISYSGLAGKLAEKLNDPGFIVYAVCNSLQLLAKLDLMPFSVGTVQNDSGKHETLSWDLKLTPPSDTVWLSYLKDYKEPIFAPISHGEGRIIVPDSSIQTVNDNDYLALKFVDGHMCEFYRSSRGKKSNPNGSPRGWTGFEWEGNLALFSHFERLRLNGQREDKDIVPKSEWDKPYEPTYLMFQAATDKMKKN